MRRCWRYPVANSASYVTNRWRWRIQSLGFRGGDAFVHTRPATRLTKFSCEEHQCWKDREFRRKLSLNVDEFLYTKNSISEISIIDGILLMMPPSLKGTAAASLGFRKNPWIVGTRKTDNLKNWHGRLRCVCTADRSWHSERFAPIPAWNLPRSRFCRLHLGAESRRKLGSVNIRGLHSGAITELLQADEDRAVNRRIQTGSDAFQDLRQEGASGNSRATGHAFSADF